ncbi:MAG: hypothetical protein JO215_15760 [Ktedonobacteraceae bacterium]|nr:hypothetical protein [Ktedonobacteraceae bacterium]
MTERCPECGALLTEGNTCQSIFDEVLSLEYTNPEYGKVHFLTVTCFMIQHGRYSDEALAWAKSALRAYLDEGVTAQQIRQRTAKETNRATRTWKITRQAGAPPLPKVAWSTTIADVAQSLQDAGKYCEQIEKWAHITLQEMEVMQP